MGIKDKYVKCIDFILYKIIFWDRNLYYYIKDICICNLYVLIV